MSRDVTLFLMLCVSAAMGVGASLYFFLRANRLAKMLRQTRERHLGLRRIIRERDAAEREPLRIAFESGRNVGLREFPNAVQIETACDCTLCRAERWAVN